MSEQNTEHDSDTPAIEPAKSAEGVFKGILKKGERKEKSKKVVFASNEDALILPSYLFITDLLVDEISHFFDIVS